MAAASLYYLQDIVIDALRSAVILIILERLFLTRSLPWLEQHLDYLCLQAYIFGDTALSFTDQIAVFWRNTRRLS